jgi:hypothetical protein
VHPHSLGSIRSPKVCYFRCCLLTTASLAILDPDKAGRFGDIIITWMLHQQRIALGKKEQFWVEHGFARFGGRSGANKVPERLELVADDQAGDKEDHDAVPPVFDEPLIMFAADQLLSKTSFGLDQTVLRRLSSAPGRGTHFKETIAVYFSKAFGPDVRLCDVFDFGDSIPQWATIQGVDLVALSGGLYHVVDRFRGDGCSMALCSALSNGQEVVDWFKNPSSTMCFPDKLFGPDLVFFVRVRQRPRATKSSKILCVIVQARYRSDLRVAPSAEEDAVSTLIPSEFYNYKVTSLLAYPQIILMFGCRITLTDNGAHTVILSLTMLVQFVRSAMTSGFLKAPLFYGFSQPSLP